MIAVLAQRGASKEAAPTDTSRRSAPNLRCHTALGWGALLSSSVERAAAVISTRKPGQALGIPCLDSVQQ